MLHRFPHITLERLHHYYIHTRSVFNNIFMQLGSDICRIHILVCVQFYMLIFHSYICISAALYAYTSFMHMYERSIICLNFLHTYVCLEHYVLMLPTYICMYTIPLASMDWYQHIDTKTKWTLIDRRHFQIHLLNNNCFVCIKLSRS